MPNAVHAEPNSATGARILPFAHPQGCRGYLIVDPGRGEALALDVHLDLVDALVDRLDREAWTLRWVVDSHTHADHPSGSAAVASRTGAERVAHRAGGHRGVRHFAEDGEGLPLGALEVRVHHAPGHTPDHMMLEIDGALFTGDSLLIGSVARTDFIGGDAGTLYDSLHRVLDGLPDGTLVYPGHDYRGRGHSELGEERRTNPWLGMERDPFVRELSANPPPRPANMDALLELNREGVEVPAEVSADEARELVEAGGATSVIDVRSGAEFRAEHLEGSRWIPLDQIGSRLDEVRATPAPRLLLCRSGARAERARAELEGRGVSGLRVVVGGLEAYRNSGGRTIAGDSVISLERQVRIGAGSLVVLGSLLAWWLHPTFLGLPLFVGGGLIFAGVTDWCGMGLLLAKAPWNRGGDVPGKDPGVPSACAAGAPSACSAGAPTAPSAPSSCAASAPSTDSSQGVGT